MRNARGATLQRDVSALGGSAWSSGASPGQWRTASAVQKEGQEASSAQAHEPVDRLDPHPRQRVEGHPLDVPARPEQNGSQLPAPRLLYPPAAPDVAMLEKEIGLPRGAEDGQRPPPGTPPMARTSVPSGRCLTINRYGGGPGGRVSR